MGSDVGNLDAHKVDLSLDTQNYSEQHREVLAQAFRSHGFEAQAYRYERRTIENLPAAAKGFRVLMMCHARQRARKGTITVRQERGKRILGGNTFVLRAVPKRG